MKKPDAAKRYFFVDESGDPTFFDQHGNEIIGPGGAAGFLLIGYIRTDRPESIRKALSNLRTKLAGDPIYQGIPSFQKTLRSFHAKDDSPEVRSEVFKVLRRLPIKAQFILARKRVRTFRRTFNSREGAFYDHLVTHLFKRSLHLATENHIFFSKRGSSARQAPLAAAVRKAVTQFKAKYKNVAATTTRIYCQTPIGEPCLQAIDYYLWAVQRVYTKREDRFYKSIEKHVEFGWDLYDTENYPRNIYTSKNPLDLEKISPL